METSSTIKREIFLRYSAYLVFGGTLHVELPKQGMGILKTEWLVFPSINRVEAIPVKAEEFASHNQALSLKAIGGVKGQNPDFFRFGHKL